MKKRLLMAALLLTLCIGCLFTVASATEDTTPALNTDYANLSYSDSVYIKYAVSAKNVVEDDVRLLVWREPDENGYVYGTQDEIILPAYKDTIEGEEYIIFDYKNIAAKEMGDDIYVRPMVQVGETVYTGEAVKYSVLRYAYDTIHDDTAAVSLQELMRDMLAYGASAQAHFNYKTDTPVYNKSAGTIDWYDITLVNGTLADGFARGFVYQNTEIALMANTAPDGQVFSHWEDCNGNVVSTDEACTATVNGNTTYTAIYLKYTGVAGYRSYEISGFGSPAGSAAYIPATVEEGTIVGIYNNAFNNCTSLTKIVIPDSIVEIGHNAFSGCSNLTELYITNLANWCNIKFWATGSNPFDSAYSVGGNLFLNNELVTTLKIPAGVTSVGNYAFYNCKSITNVEIPDNVTSIGYSAFQSCTELKTIKIGTGITDIEDHAFLNCTNLTAVYISDLASWCHIAFSTPYSNPLLHAHNLYLDNNLIENLNIPDNTTSIGNYTFSACTSITDVVVPDSVTYIGDEAFSNCTNLANIQLSDKVTSIGIAAFQRCTNLSSIEIPGNVTSIENFTFIGCTELKSVTLPETVTNIGNAAFQNCKSLISINIPSGVSNIGTHAFNDDISLTNIILPDNITCINDYSFCGCTSLTNVNIPKEVTSIGAHAFSGCNFTSIDIPNKVAKIGTDAFSNCRNLTSVSIPDSVTNIGECAFYDCVALTSIVIPDNVIGIGAEAFGQCNSLKSISFGKGISSIGRYAFRLCHKLESVTFKNPAGWWYASSFSATSGTALAEADLEDDATAAEYLCSTYSSYYWKRS